MDCPGANRPTTNQQAMRRRADTPVKNRIPFRVYTQNVTRIPGRHFLRNLVERRALVAQLVRRDFQMRYVGSVAGWAWGVVHPLVLLASWIFVFKICLKITLPPGSVTDNYP